MFSEKYSASNPAYNVRPGLKFAFSHPAHTLALFFGAGCLRPGPGTWGTLAGVLAWMVLVQFLSWKALAVCIAVLFVLGALASEKLVGISAYRMPAVWSSTRWLPFGWCA